MSLTVDYENSTITHGLGGQRGAQSDKRIDQLFEVKETMEKDAMEVAVAQLLLPRWISSYLLH